MRPHVAVIVGVLALLAALAFVGGGARAVNWCPDATVTVSPTVTSPNVGLPYTVLVNNGGSSALILTDVIVRFSFETSDRTIFTGNETVPAGSSATFDTPIVNAPAGGFTMTIRLDGHPEANPSDVGQCTKTATVQTVTPPSFGTGFVAWILFLAVILVVVVVVAVVLVVVLAFAAGRRSPPPWSYPPQAPPSYPPPTPPYGPPPQPPPNP